MTPSLSRPSGSATLRGLASEQVVPPAPGRAPPTAAQTPGGAGRMGPGFDPAFWRGLRGCLCCAVRGMTASPPRFAAWRARVPGPLARSAPLLLLLLWTAAASQGHPRNGPRISAVWKESETHGQPVTQSELATTLVLASTPESQLLAPRAIPQGPHQCPPASSLGRSSPTISSAKPYSTPCRPPGSPAFR
nr:uncharacterized protein LOC108407303 isoform X3 [Manis javanica]